MWCFISQPNSVVFEVTVDPKSIGQDCLEKVCEYLGISNESDYFGLKYESHKGEDLWLNLRNPIDRQVNSHGHTAPLRFALRVKFWVPPQFLLQENTRHQFYLHARIDLMQNRLLASNWDCVAKLIALIAQAESGDYDGLHPPHNVYNQASSILPTADPATQKPQDLLQKIINEHKKCKGYKRSTAEYWLLKEIADLEGYGEEIFNAKHATLGVGPHGITIYDKTKEKQLISFTNIVTASSHRRSFKLEYLSVDSKVTLLEIKLDSNHVASGLYRAITEKHAFYSCDSVRTAVTTQCIRDLKGTIVSIFNEDSTLGKKYVFDIRKTCREVYDNAKRALYQENVMQLVPEDGDNEQVTIEEEGEHCKDSTERLNRLMEALTCKICMDSEINAAFVPCWHTVACTECAARCNRCPVCRAEVTHAQKLYMPSDIRQ